MAIVANFKSQLVAHVSSASKPYALLLKAISSGQLDVLEFKEGIAVSDGVMKLADVFFDKYCHWFSETDMVANGDYDLRVRCMAPFSHT